jgi:predicted nucleic acid-binding protein
LPEVICNTSPLQYLHQIGQLSIIPALVRAIVVPPSVVVEIDAGMQRDRPTTTGKSRMGPDSSTYWI